MLTSDLNRIGLCDSCCADHSVRILNRRLFLEEVLHLTPFIVYWDTPARPPYAMSSYRIPRPPSHQPTQHQNILHPLQPQTNPLNPLSPLPPNHPLHQPPPLLQNLLIR